MFLFYFLVFLALVPTNRARHKHIGERTEQTRKFPTSAATIAIAKIIVVVTHHRGKFPSVKVGIGVWSEISRLSYCMYVEPVFPITRQTHLTPVTYK